MSLFAFPLPPSSARHTIGPPTKPVKRKRSQSRSPYPPAETAAEYEAAADRAFATNPLSLAPDEVVQYRLAGLRLDKQLPDVRQWPHRGLSNEYVLSDKKHPVSPVARLPKGEGEEGTDQGDQGETGNENRQIDVEDEGGHDSETHAEEYVAKPSASDAESKDVQLRAGRESRLRRRHLQVLVTLLQRCLLEGDMKRANKAWTLLLRTESSGRAVDLKAPGIWGIGAELLMRAGEGRSQDLKSYREDDTNELGDDEDQSPTSGGLTSDKEGGDNREIVQERDRWGTPSGWAATKDYYDRLILQYPYISQFKHLLSSLDLWPALLTCEIYNLQQDYEGSIRKLQLAELEMDYADTEIDQQSGDNLSNHEYGDDDAYIDAMIRQRVRHEQRARERARKLREDLRQATLVKASRLLAQMAQLMDGLPWSDSVPLGRLHGMLTLWAADLNMSVHQSDDTGSAEEDEDDSDDETKRQMRIRRRQIRRETEKGIEVQQEMREQALKELRAVARKITKRGGLVDESLKKVLLKLEADVESHAEDTDAEMT